MAKRTRRQERRHTTRGPLLSAETAANLWLLVLLAVAGVSVLALLGIAGPFGMFWQRTLAILFGWTAWLFPAFLLVLIALRIRPFHGRRSSVVLFGVGLFILSFAGLVDTLIPLDPALRATVAGEGGGYIGLFLRSPLETILGAWGAIFVLLVLLSAAVVITLEITLAHIAESFGAGMSAIVDFFAGVLRGFRRPIPTTTVATTERTPSFTTAVVSHPEEPDEDQVKEAAEAVLPGLTATRRPYKAIPIDLPLDLLKPSSGKPTSGDINANRDIIKQTLGSFGIAVEMGEISVGPTVTQYTLKPDQGVKLAAITTLSNDLSLALAAHPIRIEAPIPGRSLVGIEVPNKAVARVQLREVLEGEGFQKRTSNLALALGKDVSGAAWVADLERMPHLLVAGSTGSGKSVALNGIIVSLLYQNNPTDLKFILVDPKRVEFAVYQHMPHLLTPIITELPATVNALKWLLGEMDRRFTVLAAASHRNIQSYNLKEKERMPYIVVIIDELADIMTAAASEVESAIIRLSQMSRAVGIHLILATQRPSVDVITGLIKANIIARIAFSVASITDSRTILDMAGAEKLLGRGDLLYVSAEVTKPKRLQGAYLADEEIADVVRFLKNNATPEYVDEVVTKPSAGGGAFDGEPDDPLYREAESLVLTTRKASASYLQRRLKVGYARAARLIDMMEAQGVVGPGDGAKPRDVLLAAEGDDTVEDSIEESTVDNDYDQ
ncbi:MAG: DNA translocase FtsK 4TM domain-containing protein [Patescibacteria group bacterium]